MANFKIEVFKDETKQHNPWTFTIDGAASGMWCPTQHAAQRVVNRLLEGRSREAFGGSLQAQTPSGSVTRQVNGQGRATITQVEREPPATTRKLGSGKEKPAASVLSYRVELDGEEAGVFDNRKEAEVTAAVRAFMTRGKLGRLKEAEETFETEYGTKATAEYDGKTVRMKVQGNATHVARIEQGKPITFKPYERSPDTTDG